MTHLIIANEYGAVVSVVYATYVVFEPVWANLLKIISPKILRTQTMRARRHPLMRSELHNFRLGLSHAGHCLDQELPPDHGDPHLARRL